MKLIAFDGTFTLKPCCAKPGNRVRLATVEDIAQWLKSHPSEHEAVERALAALRAP